MRSRKFQSQIFRNFRDCFRTVWAKFSGLFVQDFGTEYYKFFRNGFGQSQTGLRFGFDPGTNVFEFNGVFWYHSNSVTNRERTKRCPILYEPEIWAILCVIIGKINNILLCVKFILIYANVMY